MTLLDEKCHFILLVLYKLLIYKIILDKKQRVVMRIKQIAAIGECMVELKKTGDGISLGFGGDTLNTAIYLSRLTYKSGITTSYITGLGKDSYSREMISRWHLENINTDNVEILEGKLPGLYSIETSSDGERQFNYWRNDSAAKYWLSNLELPSLIDELSHYELIYLSAISIAILSVSDRAKLIRALSQCRRNGSLVAFDNNYRPALWESSELAQFWYQEVMKNTDIAFLTFDDDVLLWDDKSEQETTTRAQALGVKEIIIKRGADYCMVVTDNDIINIPSVHVDNVVDTTAAGDSFSAGYLANRVLGGNWNEAALAGHKIASAVIQHPGAIIPIGVMPII